MTWSGKSRKIICWLGFRFNSSEVGRPQAARRCLGPMLCSEELRRSIGIVHVMLLLASKPSDAPDDGGLCLTHTVAKHCKDAAQHRCVSVRSSSRRAADADRGPSSILVIGCGAPAHQLACSWSLYGCRCSRLDKMLQRHGHCSGLRLNLRRFQQFLKACQILVLNTKISC